MNTKESSSTHLSPSLDLLLDGTSLFCLLKKYLQIYVHVHFRTYLEPYLQLYVLSILKIMVIDL